MLSYRVLLPDRATAYTFFAIARVNIEYMCVAGPHAAAGIVADRRELYARAGTHAAVAAGSDPPAGLRVAAGTTGTTGTPRLSTCRPRQPYFSFLFHQVKLKSQGLRRVAVLTREPDGYPSSICAPRG